MCAALGHAPEEDGCGDIMRGPPPIGGSVATPAGRPDLRGPSHGGCGRPEPGGDSASHESSPAGESTRGPPTARSRRWL